MSGKHGRFVETRTEGTLPLRGQDASRALGLNLHNNMPGDAALDEMVAAGIHWYTWNLENTH